MLQFKTERLTDRVTRIFAFAGELMYLVEGKERAALLDTGSGLGSLKGAVAGLTGKPVIVLLTHGHYDHAMGASEFSEVYMNRLDDYILVPHSNDEFRRGRIAPDMPARLEAGEFIPGIASDRLMDLKGGDVFDLGGETIEIYDCPGHTRGSVVMLMKEERAVLLGDACNPFTFMFADYSDSIADYRKSLERLEQELKGKYDRVYFSHGGGDGPVGIIREVIEVCDDIMNGNTDDIPYHFGEYDALIAKKTMPAGGRADGKSGNIVYRKEKIWC